MRRPKKLTLPLSFLAGLLTCKLEIDIFVYSLMQDYPETFAVIGGMIAGVFLLQKHLIPALTKESELVLPDSPKE